MDKQKGIEGLSDNSRRPHNIKYKKITSEIEETILDLRLTKRFGCSRTFYCSHLFIWSDIRIRITFQNNHLLSKDFTSNTHLQLRVYALLIQIIVKDTIEFLFRIIVTGHDINLHSVEEAGIISDKLFK